MKPWVLFTAVFFTAAEAIPAYNRDDVALPIFTRVACPEEDQLCTKTSTKRPPDLCVKVLYQDAEGSHDLLLMREKADAPTVLKGRLKSKPRAKAVIILADADNDADTFYSFCRSPS